MPRPNMFDYLDAESPAPGGPAPSVVQPAPQRPTGRPNMFDYLDEAPARAGPSPMALPKGKPEGRTTSATVIGQSAPSSGKVGVAEDVERSFDSGVASGIAGMVGLPQFLKQGVNDLTDWVTGASPERRAQANERGRVSALDLPTSEGTLATIEKAAGPLHVPQTKAGEYARTGGEFASGALFGAGTLGQRVAQVAVPAALSETAGQVTRGTELEPVARIGGAIAGGLGTAVVQARRGAQAMVSEGLAGISPQEMAAARGLIDEARALPGGGVTLTLDEALNQVTGGRATRLSQLNRVVTNSGGEGGQRMADLYAGRPGQVNATGREAIESIGPANPSPSSIGPAVGREAEGVVAEGQRIINDGTRRFYTASDNARVGPQVGGALAGDPLYEATLRAVRNDPALNRGIAHLPDDSGAVLDLVQRRMREQADNARVPGQASTSNLAAANFEDARTAPIAALETATGSRPGTAASPPVVGNYEAARAAQAAAREQFLQPLLDGPIGRLAQQDIGTQRAISVLFPENPLPNSAGEVATAVHALSRRGATGDRAARDLVRAHIESAFNDATANLQGGPNVMGGARFARDLMGNPQAAANVESAIRALPHGDAVADGFNRFVEVMRATGHKPPKGSDTAFNQAISENMKGAPGVVGAAVEQATMAGLGLKKYVSDKWAGFRVGQNTEQLAYLLTDPAAVPLLRQLSTETVGTGRAEYLAARILSMSERALNGRRRPAQ